MSDLPGGPGWWQASDGKWYPPQPVPQQQQQPLPVTPPAKKSKLPFIIGGVGAVILLVIAVVVFAGGGGSKKEDVTAGGSTASSGVTTTAPSSGPQTTSRSSSTQSANADVVVLETGFVAAPDPYDATTQTVSGAAVVVNNGSTQAGRIEANFTFLGASGQPFSSEGDFLTFLNPGEKGFMTVEDRIPVGNTVTKLEVVLAVEMEPYGIDYQPHTFPTSDVRFEPASTSYVHVVGTVTNDLSEPVDQVQITCLVRDANGVLLTGDTTYSDVIAPGQSVAFEALIPAELVPTAVSAEARAVTSASTAIG